MVRINKIDIENTLKRLYSCNGPIDVIDDGTVTVNGNCKLIRSTPTLGVMFGTIHGDFACSNSQLTTLKGGPSEVTGDYFCNFNVLTSLEGAPKATGGGFYCNDNNLHNLEHCPQNINGPFDCGYNLLTSLKGAPKSIAGDFFCFNSNLLTSLEGIPNTDKSVGFTYSPNLPLLRLVAYKDTVIYIDGKSDDSTYTDLIAKWRDAEGSLRSRIVGFQNELIAKGCEGNAKW